MPNGYILRATSSSPLWRGCSGGVTGTGPAPRRPSSGPEGPTIFAVICLRALQGLAFVAPGFLDLALLILVGLEGVVAWLLRLSSYAS